jgi:hypothetical protein
MATQAPNPPPPVPVAPASDGRVPHIAETAAESPSGVWDWLNDRLGLSALTYAVLAHANTLWYTLGGITFFGIIVLAGRRRGADRGERLRQASRRT